MADVAEKVRKLIALAGSASPEEARTAAATACKLIREHGLEVVPKRPPRPTSARPVDFHTWASSIDWVAEAARAQARANAATILAHDCFCYECGARVVAGTPCLKNPVMGARHIDCDGAARVARGEPR